MSCLNGEVEEGSMDTLWLRREMEHGHEIVGPLLNKIDIS